MSREEKPGSSRPSETRGDESEVAGLRSEAKLMIRHSTVYGSVRVFDRAIGFLMLPIFTRFLTTNDYGILELIYMTLAYVSVVVDIGVNNAVSRFYYESKDPDKRALTVSTTIVGFGGITLAFVVPLMLTSRLAATHIVDSPDLSGHFIVAFATLFFEVLVAIGFTYLRLRKQSGLFALFSASRVAITVLLNLLFLMHFQLEAMGVLLASLAAAVLSSSALMIYVVRETGFRVSMPLLREMVAFGLPLVPANVATNIARSSDRFFIKAFASVADAGLYGLGYKVGMVVHQFVTSSFLQIWGPRRLETFRDASAQRHFATIFTYFSILLCWVGLGVALLSGDIVRLMTTEPYWGAAEVVPLIVLAHVVMSLYYHFWVPILVAKRTGDIAWVNGITCAVALTANWVLISRYGGMGAAWSTLATYLCRSGLAFVFARRLGPLEFEALRYLHLVGVAAALYGAGVWLLPGTDPLAAAGRLGLGLAYPATLLVTGFFSKGEIDAARDWAASRTGR